MDKAGAYGIQGRAKVFVSALNGCYNNVMGFPVQRFCRELQVLEKDGEL
jgi:septum formation protein